MTKKSGGGFVNSIINDMKNNKSVFEPAYETVATIGLIYKFIGAVITTIVCILAIILGIYFMRFHSEKTGKTTGFVKEVSCSKASNKSECNGTIEYTVGGTKYSKNYTFTTTNPKNDFALTVYYDPLYPDNFNVETYTYYVGVGLTFVASLVMLLSWVFFAMSYFFKPLRAAEGIDAITDVFD